MLSVLDPYRVKSKEIWGYNCAQHKETKMEAFSISLFGVLLEFLSTNSIWKTFIILHDL